MRKSTIIIFCFLFFSLSVFAQKGIKQELKLFTWKSGKYKVWLPERFDMAVNNGEFYLSRAAERYPSNQKLFELKVVNFKWKGKKNEGFLHGNGILKLTIQSGRYETNTFDLEYRGNFDKGFGDGEFEVICTVTNDDNEIFAYYHYTGDMKKSHFNGIGTLFSYDIDYDENKKKTISRKYVGHFKNGMFHGAGKEYTDEITPELDGFYLYGEYQGIGPISGFSEVKYEDGTYKGNFHNHKRNGFGIMVYNDGSKYEGQWENEKYNGSGKLYWKNGSLKYEGIFIDGLYDGSGKLFKEDGTLEYSGGFEAGNKGRFPIISGKAVNEFGHPVKLKFRIGYSIRITTDENGEFQTKIPLWTKGEDEITMLAYTKFESKHKVKKNNRYYVSIFIKDEEIGYDLTNLTFENITNQENSVHKHTSFAQYFSIGTKEYERRKRQMNAKGEKTYTVDSINIYYNDSRLKYSGAAIVKERVLSKGVGSYTISYYITPNGKGTVYFDYVSQNRFKIEGIWNKGSLDYTKKATMFDIYGNKQIGYWHYVNKFLDYVIYPDKYIFLGATTESANEGINNYNDKIEETKNNYNKLKKEAETAYLKIKTKTVLNTENNLTRYKVEFTDGVVVEFDYNSKSNKYCSLGILGFLPDCFSTFNELVEYLWFQSHKNSQ